MFNNENFVKICNMNCTLEELEKFNMDIDNIEYDYDNSFQKYYDVNLILSAVEKYQNGVISDRFLAYWANAYNWIIMASEWKNENTFAFKQYIQSEISEMLDSLSFFDEIEKEYYNLKSFKRDFIFLDDVYNHLDDYDVYFRPLTGEYFYDHDVNIVAVNRKTKKFIKFNYAVLKHEDSNINAEELDIHKMTKMVKELKSQGYVEYK